MDWVLIWLFHCKLTQILIFRKVIVITLLVVVRLKVVDLLMLVLVQRHLLLALRLADVLLI